ncbi:MAG: hypothetical protein Q8P18_26900, partial [Pseudomonadota bacterium]|nr:hypothetical protein [Pseudomonadota bacterium]
MQEGSRFPNCFTKPRTTEIIFERVSTSTARTRSVARCCRLSTLRCVIGERNFGSRRTRRASVSACDSPAYVIPPSPAKVIALSPAKVIARGSAEVIALRPAKVIAL